MVTLNVAFLNEIKADNVSIGQVLKSIRTTFNGGKSLGPRSICELLGRLRDELETHFALEEFYGYFDEAEMTHSQVSRAANSLIGEHTELFSELNSIIENAEQLLYDEAGHKSESQIILDFQFFDDKLREHELKEMELMQKLCNDEFGTGD